MAKETVITITEYGGRYQITHQYPEQSGHPTSRIMYEETTAGLMQKLWEILNHQNGRRLIITGNE